MLLQRSAPRLMEWQGNWQIAQSSTRVYREVLVEAWAPGNRTLNLRIKSPERVVQGSPRAS